jgi:serine/threonine protein kinase
MGNNPGKPHADTFLETISGTSSLPNEKSEEVFNSIIANISKKTLGNVKNMRGEGPIACCCYNASYYYLDKLLELGYDYSKDNAGNTPLHIATILTNEYAIEKISGRWPNLLSVKNNAMKTPLDIATDLNNTQITSLLVRMIERGDDPFSRYQKHINPEIRKMFIHLDRFRNRVKADFAGGQSVIYLSDMLLPTGTSVKVVMKGATARAASGDAAILREIKVLQQALQVCTVKETEIQPNFRYSTAYIPHTTDGHPNIIHFFGFTLDDRFVYLVSPYTPLGDLHRWILNNASSYIPVDVNFLSEECRVPLQDLSNDELRQFNPAFVTDIDTQNTTIRFICQIARGLKYLHSLGIIHNDIKPMNCLLFTDASGLLTIKLIDFGLSVIDQDPEFMNTPMASPATIPYVATERLGLVSIFSNPPSVKTDMYAFGATVWHLVTGKKPYYYVAHRTAKMRLPLIPALYLGDVLGEFVNRCISNNPSDRPINFEDIINVDYNIVDSSSDEDHSFISKTTSSEDISAGEVITIKLSSSSDRSPQIRKSPNHQLLVPSINLGNVITTGPYRIPSPRRNQEIAASSDYVKMLTNSEISEIQKKFENAPLTILDPTMVTTDMIIGEGNFGRVFRGVYNQKRIAVKVLKYINSFSSEEKKSLVEEFIKESVALSTLSHVERITRVIGVTIEPMQLVMEYYPKGSMADVLRKEPDLHFITRVSLIKDIAEGVMNMHTNYGIHRDIAARNILVDEDYRAYISDFGKTRFSREQYAQTHDKIVAVKWASPESFSKGEEMTYSVFTDVWAFGVTVYEILTNEEPYRDVSHADMIKILGKREGKFLSLGDVFDDELCNMVDVCLSWKPEDRSDMEEHYVVLESYLDTLIQNRWWLGRKHHLAKKELLSVCSSSTDSL